MYEGLPIADQELLQALDSIIHKTFAEQTNLNALAKRALDRYVHTGNTVFLNRLAQAAPACGVQDPISCIRYILGDSIAYSRKENEFKLRLPIKARRLLHDFRQRNDCEFSDIANLVMEEKEAAKTMKKAKAEEKPDLPAVQTKIDNYLKKLAKENAEDAEILALVTALQEANRTFQLPTQEAEVVVDA